MIPTRKGSVSLGKKETLGFPAPGTAVINRMQQMGGRAWLHVRGRRLPGGVGLQWQVRAGACRDAGCGAPTTWSSQVLLEVGFNDTPAFSAMLGAHRERARWTHRSTLCIPGRMPVSRASSARPLEALRAGWDGHSWWDCPLLSRPLGATALALPQTSVCWQGLATEPPSVV